jgi:signal transduction histidine kinase
MNSATPRGSRPSGPPSADALPAPTEVDLRRRSRQLEDRVRERTRELEIANSELKAFSTAVSHDLRAPLAMVRTFSTLLLQSGGLDEQALAHARRIHAAAEHMDEIIHALLGLSSPEHETFHPQSTDIAALLRTALCECAESSTQEVAIEMTVAPGTQVMADPGLLRVVLTNLLGNAWKFTRGVEHPRVAVDCRAISALEVAIRISDNGAGFDPHQAHRLFQPFQRLHAAAEFPGIGIGLATVHRIVQRHGGRIEAQGEPGHGACFTVTLPRTRDMLTLACRTCGIPGANGTRTLGCSTTRCDLMPAADSAASRVSADRSDRAPSP